MLINPAYRRLWAGQTVSVLGDYAFDTTLLLWVGAVLLQGDDYAPLVSSAFLVLGAVSTILVSPLAGVLADRSDGLRTMMVADVVRAVAVLVLIGLAVTPRERLPMASLLVAVACVVVVGNAAGQFFGPARAIVLRQVVADRDQDRAAGYAQSTSAIAEILGPPLAAPVLISFGVVWAFGFNLLSFAVSLAAILSLRRLGAYEHRTQGAGQSPKSSVRASLREGIVYCRANPTLRTIFIAVFATTLGSGTLNALEVYFLQENLGADPKWFGTLAMAYGLGVLAGAFVCPFLVAHLGRRPIFSYSLLAFGITFVLYSRVSDLAVALALNVLFGIALGTLNTVAFPLMFAVTREDFVGRVVSLVNPLSQVAAIGGLGLSGILAGTLLADMDTTILGIHFGRIDTIFLAGGCICVGAALYSMASFSRESVDRTDAAVEQL